MGMPGRHSTGSGYRFGFNGKEKDDEVKGDGNSLDFGARMYDPRICRWLSLDPLQHKYPQLGPYNFVANSPIIFLDPNGRENIIYVVFLPSKDCKLTPQDVERIIEQANQNFQTLGLKTQVKLASEYKDFDFSKIDKHDAVAVIGSVKNVKEYIKTNNPRSYENFHKNWKGGEGNSYDVERSENEHDKDGNGAGGNVIAIDGNAVLDAGAKMGITGNNSTIIRKLGALVINHGAGHNAKEYHYGDDIKPYTTSVLMQSGEELKKDFTASPTTAYETLVSNKDGQNKDYVKDMKKRFSDNTPTTNFKK